MDWKLIDRSGAGDSGEEASSWAIWFWKEFVPQWIKVLEDQKEKELGRQVPVQKARLAEMSDKIRSEISTLMWESLFSKMGVPSEHEPEKSVRARILEALDFYWWKTTRQVCCEVYPELVGGSKDWMNASKSVSMQLLRLSNVNGEKLVECDRTAKEHRYRVLPGGIKKRARYGEERRKAGIKRLLRGRMQNVVKGNEELLPEINAIMKSHGDALLILENAGLAHFFQQNYGRKTSMLVHQIVLLQRAILDDDDDLRTKAISESANALLELCASEVDMTEAWMFMREEQKRLKSQIAQVESEIEELRWKNFSRDVLKLQRKARMRQAIWMGLAENARRRQLERGFGRDS